ncbi:MAG: hypothetical protein WKG07_32605 [Hymenobacter sp.]
MRVAAPQPEPDPEAEQEFLREAQAQVRILRQAAFWLAELDRQVQQQGVVAFEDFAQRIARAEAPHEVYSILALVVSRALNETAPQRGWQVDTVMQEPPFLIF